jgi:hypothetical protein
MKLSIGYFTNRRTCMIEWFFDSLEREMKPYLDDVQIVVVDFYADEPGRKWEILSKTHGRFRDFWHVSVKPNVWQGPYRLTKEDRFAAANTRNTFICCAKHPWLAFVDDLSVLMPGWWSRVDAAMGGNYIGLGSYRKVKNLVVEKGEVKSCELFPGGVDSRLQKLPGPGQYPCDGGWMYGCSVTGPLEAFLTIGGFPEICDGLGSEDYVAGIALENNGFKLVYDTQMITYESEEHHHLEKPFKRSDKGISPNDKSHALLNMVRGGCKYFPNYFGEGGIRTLRDKILAGEPFPITQIPEHDWYDSEPIRNM